MTPHHLGPPRAAAAWPVLPLLGASLGVLPADPYPIGRWGLASLGAAVVLVAGHRQEARGGSSGVLPWGALAAAAALVPLGSTPYLLAHATAAVRWAVGLGLAWAVARMGDRAWTSVPWLLAFGGVEAGLALLQAAGLSWPHPPGAGFRLGAGGTFPNPNWAASLLAPLLPLAIHWSLEAFRDRRWGAAPIAPLLAAGLFATRSRGGIAAAAIGSLAMAGARVWPRLSVRARRAVLAAALLGACVAGASVWAAGHRIPGMEGRTFLWRTAARIAAEHPWTGVGLRGFAPAYPGAAAEVLSGVPGTRLPLGIVGGAHNVFLQLAAEAGIPVALGFLGLTGFAALRALAAGPEWPAAAGGAVVAWAAHGLVDPPLQTPVGFYLYWYLTGLALAVAAGGSPKRGRLLCTSGLRLGRWIPLVLALLAAADGGRLVGADALRRRGAAARAGGDREGGLRLVGRASSLAPETGALRSLHAQLLAAGGRPRPALAELESARRLWFSFHDLFLYGRLVREVRGRTAAIAYWRHLAQALPPLVRPHFELGRLYEERGDRDAAVRAYRAVLASAQPTGAAEALRRAARKRLAALAAE